jgi:hypothetical protein
MKITIEGVDYEFVPLANPNGTFQYTGLKPIEPKSEKKEYILDLFSRHGHHPVHEKLDLTEPTANKLSEAISALVEYVTNKNQSWDYDTKIEEARKSFQESQS